MSNSTTVVTTVDFESVAIDDPRVLVVFYELAHDFWLLYGPSHAEQFRQLTSYPNERFTAAQRGLFVIGSIDGLPVVAGAYQKHNEHTAELKRIWTAPDYRRQGLNIRLLVELERQAVLAGYTDLYLTTGHKQTGAMALYQKAGFRPQPPLPPEERDVIPHPFIKHIESD